MMYIHRLLGMFYNDLSLILDSKVENKPAGVWMISYDQEHKVGVLAH